MSKKKNMSTRALTMIEKIVFDLTKDLPCVSLLFKTNGSFSGKFKVFEIFVDGSINKDYLVTNITLSVFLRNTYPELSMEAIKEIILLINKKLKNLGFPRKRVRVSLTEEQALENKVLAMREYGGRLYAFHGIKLSPTSLKKQIKNTCFSTKELHVYVEKLTQGIPCITSLRHNSLIQISGKNPFFQFFMSIDSPLKRAYFLTINSIRLLIKDVYPHLTPTQSWQLQTLIEKKLTTLGFSKKLIYTKVNETEGEFIMVFENIRILKREN